MNDLFSGFNLNDLGQTAADIIAAQNSGPITSAGPAVNPAAINAQTLATQTQQVTAPAATNYTPYIIGGVALVGVLVLVFALRK